MYKNFLKYIHLKPKTFQYRKLLQINSIGIQKCSNSQCACCKKSKFEYEIKKVKAEDHSDIFTLLTKFFLKEEPVVSSFNLSEQSIKQLAQYIMIRAVSKGFSFIVREKVETDTDKCAESVGRPLGFAINTIAIKEETDNDRETIHLVEDEKLRRLCRFWFYIDDSPQLWQKFNIKKIFELSYLLTIPEARHHGIATKLVEKSIDVAKREDYTIFRIDATNHFTTEICKKFKMIPAQIISYENYYDSFEKKKLPCIGINPNLQQYCTIYVLQLNDRIDPIAKGYLNKFPL